MSEQERFWSKVDVRGQDECWPWLASVEVSGHPVFHLWGGKKMRAHRYALQIRLGRPIAEGSLACHLCNNPSCVNPAHMYEGSHASNSDDKVRAGRQMRGSRYPASRLTEATVRQIVALYRAGGVTQLSLGERFGLCQSEVSRIVNGKSWAHATTLDRAIA